MTTLLLLHGLAGTGSAWAGLREVADWDGPVLALDLPGHGAAGRLPAYDVPSTAAALAAELGPGDWAVLGHSWGGAVGVALAGLGLGVRSVAAVGVKARWTDEEVARFAGLAERPAKAFATRDEAVARHRAVAGLGELPGQDDGVVEVDGGWALAMDPRAWAQASPDLTGLVAASPVPVVLARGEHDPMVTRADLLACAGPTTTVLDLPGLGHAPHVEGPAALWSALAPSLRPHG